MAITKGSRKYRELLQTGNNRNDEFHFSARSFSAACGAK
jgi:hypothetical protein